MTLALEAIKQTIARYPGSERPNYAQLAALVAEVETLRAQVAQDRQWVVDANQFAYEATQGREA